LKLINLMEQVYYMLHTYFLLFVVIKYIYYFLQIYGTTIFDVMHTCIFIITYITIQKLILYPVFL